MRNIYCQEGQENEENAINKGFSMSSSGLFKAEDVSVLLSLYQ